MSAIATPVRQDSLVRAALRSPNFLVGAAITLVFVGLALLSFVWTPYDFVAQNIPNKLKPPSAELRPPNSDTDSGTVPDTDSGNPRNTGPNAAMLSTVNR